MRKPSVADSEPFTEEEVALALRLLRRFPPGTVGGGWTHWLEQHEYFAHMSHERQWALYLHGQSLLEV